MTGGAGADTFKVDVGSDIITDLGLPGGDSDVLIVSSGATANATNMVSFAGAGSSNSSGTVNLTTQAGVVL